MISPAVTQAECDALLDSAAQARAAADHDGRIEALQACIEHPCAAHAFDLADLFSELATCYRSIGRYVEAIDAWEEAIAAGYRSLPHPRAEIAGLLLTAGRQSDADALLAELRKECPNDVWLYNSAGASYAECGDHTAALRWLDDGIKLALDTGDPEQILGQLIELRRTSLTALNRDPNDELDQRVATFARPPGPRRTITDYYGGEEPAAQQCAHCGWRPDNEPSSSPLVDTTTTHAGDRTQSPVSRSSQCPCGSGRKYKRCHGSRRSGR